LCGIYVVIFYYHCHISTVHVRLIRVLLKINQSINQSIDHARSRSTTIDGALRPLHVRVRARYGRSENATSTERAREQEQLLMTAATFVVQQEECRQRTSGRYLISTFSQSCAWA